MQGWITNLLVKPEYRGRGLAKLLLAAAEGVVKSPAWRQEGQAPGKNERANRLSIHLHCDASSVSGRIPQALYKSVGYEETFVMRSCTDEEFSWMGPEALSSSVVMIEGVPLLYLRKLLY